MCTDPKESELYHCFAMSIRLAEYLPTFFCVLGDLNLKLYQDSSTFNFHTLENNGGYIPYWFSINKIKKSEGLISKLMNPVCLYLMFHYMCNVCT